MDITPYVESLREELAGAAAMGDDQVKAAAQRLSSALESAVRLTLMEALSDAATDISRNLPNGTAIELRLQGREPIFVLTGELQTSNVEESAPDSAAPEDADGSTARITFRLPESLKQRAEELAGRRGQSLNTWLVNAARLAAGIGDGQTRPNADHERRGHRPGRHVRGWVK